MQLGAFSISLSVKDLQASKEFYEVLGFKQTGGDGDNYLIMKNDQAVIGLFHGMFDTNILTFNPGLTQGAESLTEFEDVRDIRARLVEAGIDLTNDLDPDDAGPAHVTFFDPDGNALLIDQFFPKPTPEE